LLMIKMTGKVRSSPRKSKGHPAKHIQKTISFRSAKIDTDTDLSSAFKATKREALWDWPIEVTLEGY
jgi:fructose/tagatose bisphosphate aldolase